MRKFLERETDETGGRRTIITGLAAHGINAGQKAKAAQLLQRAVKPVSTTCSDRASVAFQYARMSDFKNARLTLAPCVASELKAGSGVDQAFRLYGDAFVVFEYLRQTHPGFAKHFVPILFNHSVTNLFKLQRPTMIDK